MRSRLRLLLVQSFWHPRGGDTTAVRIGAAALEARGVEIVPFAMRHPDNAPSAWETWFTPFRSARDARGSARVDAALRSVWSGEAAAALDRLLDVARPHAALVHHVHRHLTPSVLATLRRRGVPTLWTLHDRELVCPIGLGYRDGAPCARCTGGHYAEAVAGRCKGGSVAESMVVAVEKAVHRRLGVAALPDLLLSPSADLARAVIADGIDARRVVHVPNPLERGPAGGPPGPDWLLAGRMEEEKGVDDALAAARLLPGRALHLYGHGRHLDTLAPQAGVVRHGTVPAAVLAAALAGAGVVAVPSRWPENQPYAVLEAQRAGRAVVATAVGGIPELVDDGVDGVLVPPRDPARLAAAVGALFDDPARAARLGAAARERVLRVHDADRWARRIETLVEGAVRQRASRSGEPARFPGDPGGSPPAPPATPAPPP